MSKLVFQIGLLSFCVSIIAYISNGTPLLNAVLRSFIIFVVLTVLTTLAFALGLWLTAHQNDVQQASNRALEQKESGTESIH